MSRRGFSGSHKAVTARIDIGYRSRSTWHAAVERRSDCRCLRKLCVKNGKVLVIVRQRGQEKYHGSHTNYNIVLRRMATGVCT